MFKYTLSNHKLFIYLIYSDLQKRIKASELVFEEKQSKIFCNLNFKYRYLIKYFLISLKIDTPINLPIIFKNSYSSKNNNDIINEPNNLEKIFINKKTKRNEEKNEINQEIQEIKKKYKIFSIKKVKDKNKEIEEDKKKIIKSKTFYKKSRFRGVSRKGKAWKASIMINRNKNDIGNFKSEEEAAKAYDEYAMKFHKNKARVNFPHKGYLSV